MILAILVVVLSPLLESASNNPLVLARKVDALHGLHLSDSHDATFLVKLNTIGWTRARAWLWLFDERVALDGLPEVVVLGASILRANVGVIHCVDATVEFGGVVGGPIFICLDSVKKRGELVTESVLSWLLAEVCICIEFASVVRLDG